MNDYEVTIKIGVSGIDESDVEDKLDFILGNLDYDELNYNVDIKKVGEYVD